MSPEIIGIESNQHHHELSVTAICVILATNKTSSVGAPQLAGARHALERLSRFPQHAIEEGARAASTVHMSVRPAISVSLRFERLSATKYE